VNGTAIHLHCIENETEKHIKKVGNRDMGCRGNLSEDNQVFRNGIVHEDKQRLINMHD